MIVCKFEHGKDGSLRHVVVNVIVKKDNNVLLAKRAPHLPNGEKYGLPGGFMDRDETLIEAAAREVLEETGYEIENIKLVRIVDTPNRPREDRQNVMFLYTADAKSKVKEGDSESTEVAWFDFSRLPRREDFAYDHFEQIQYYLEMKI